VVIEGPERSPVGDVELPSLDHELEGPLGSGIKKP
jgi:hypothetical protein